MGSNELVRAGNRAVLIEAIEEHDGVSLTKIDRAYLKALEAWLDMYPEMRTTGSRAFSASAQRQRSSRLQLRLSGSSCSEAGRR